jgi:hypothetical protein
MIWPGAAFTARSSKLDCAQASCAEAKTITSKTAADLHRLISGSRRSVQSPDQLQAYRAPANYMRRPGKAVSYLGRLRTPESKIARCAGLKLQPIFVVA